MTQQYSHSDLTFITNESWNTLTDRFRTLIKDTKYFDVLVGYFYTSGFWQIYPEIESSEKIRILIWISTNREVYDTIQQSLIQSHTELKNSYSEIVTQEIESIKESEKVEKWINIFIEWLRSGKLEIRAYPTEKIHAKLYIMSFHEDDRDVGRVITGSSNFTASGFRDNLEFNVELKNRSDYEYAKAKFEELWLSGVDVSEKYIETIEKKTWLNQNISPYELYLKFLYEYFKEEINQTDELDLHSRPDNFREFEYQKHAVLNAKKIIDEYGGVFISDVVGLGKTYMGTMLAQVAGTKTIVLAPPRLLDENNPWSWRNAFKDFGFRSRDYICESIGSLDKVLDRSDLDTFDTVLIDEAHRFRNEDNETYAKMSEICHGKKVILLSATPYNNNPSDILAQIKLFQKSKSSTIPNLPNLEGFFASLEKKLKWLDRKDDKEEYKRIIKENAYQIREKVLKYIMVRRTRNDIVKYYDKDMKFPAVTNPKPIFYTFDSHESEVFNRTIELAINDFKYTRYAPLLKLKSELWKSEQQEVMWKQWQRNMMSFMRMLLVKRLESSIFAFQKTIERFIESYERFLELYLTGKVYVSPKHTHKIIEALEDGDMDYIDKLIKDWKAEEYKSDDFDPSIQTDLESDLRVLREIQELWKTIDRDPKVESFKQYLSEEKELQKGKLLIFTESAETAKYLWEELSEMYENKVIVFTWGNSSGERAIVIDNFDNNASHKKDDFRILITTDVLSEWVNLHRWNVVINYDIPWNPTRIMQRVGRINRVDTPHKSIHTFTCFPTDEGNDQLKLRESAEAKIEAFISLLGSDAKLLTDDEEVWSHTLFEKILSVDTITWEEDVESELKYLSIIRSIRDSDSALFEKIKRLPKRSRSIIVNSNIENSEVLTYFRKGRIEKFCIASNNDSRELDFMESARIMECPPDTQRAKAWSEFYNLKELNENFFETLLKNPEEDLPVRKWSSNSDFLIKILTSPWIRNSPTYTEDDEEYIEKVISELDGWSIPKNTVSKIKQQIQENPDVIMNPMKLLSLLKMYISSRFLSGNSIASGNSSLNPKEVILSLYLLK